MGILPPIKRSVLSKFKKGSHPVAFFYGLPLSSLARGSDMRILILCLGLCLALAVRAEEPYLRVEGKLIQGAMLRGDTNALRLKILERELTPKNGRFVFGLGRDAAAQLKILAYFDGANTQEYLFQVEQRQYETQSIEGVESKYVNPPESVLARIRQDSAAVRKARSVESPNEHFLEKWRWPAEGVLTGVYGSQRIFNGVPKRPHYGLDIAGPVGTPIYAPLAGTVTLAHPDMYYSGGTLILDHGQGISSTFIHLDTILVAEGEELKAGDLIAEMGATGRVTGPHLDWRVNWFEQRLDPLLLLPPREN
jgi:murein DD-endopeptidase MepM/ murein hydrolase activator NlpD